MGRKQQAQGAVSDGADRSGLQTVPLNFVRRPAVTFDGKEVCLFVTYVPRDQLLPGAVALIAAMVASGQTVVVCCAVNDPGLTLDLAGLEGATAIVTRRNGGYDFALWAAALEGMPELWSAKRLFFVNDSILGPLNGFARTLDRIRTSPADYLALTDSYEFRHHSQSYFFVLQNKAMDSPEVRRFWHEVRVEKTKTAVIRKYEVEFLNYLQTVAGLATEILFAFDRIFPGVDWSLIRAGNPTHQLWEHLLRSGFPFVKAELLFANPTKVNLAYWKPLVALHGGDVGLFQRHLAKLRETRGRPAKGIRRATWVFLCWVIGDARIMELSALWFHSRRRLK